MNKEKILEKITGGVLTSGDMTAEEKKQLYALMIAKGASEALAWTRFFRDGWAEWELQGIWRVKIEYIRQLQTQEKQEIEVRCADTVPTADGDIYKYRHYYRIDGEERSFDITEKGDFWRFLGDIRKRTHFGEYMAALGMKSQVTVAKRFSDDEWKTFELEGINSVIDELTGE